MIYFWHSKSMRTHCTCALNVKISPPVKVDFRIFHNGLWAGARSLRASMRSNRFYWTRRYSLRKLRRNSSEYFKIQLSERWILFRRNRKEKFLYWRKRSKIVLDGRWFSKTNFLNRLPVTTFWNRINRILLLFPHNLLFCGLCHMLNSFWMNTLYSFSFCTIGFSVEN